MPKQLTQSDYQYILASLKYARYAHESTPYPTEEIKRKQLSILDDMEEKLRLLRDDLAQQQGSAL